MLPVVQVPALQLEGRLQLLQTVLALVVQAVEAYCPEGQVEHETQEAALAPVE